VRPVNLIPLDQRRGSARGSSRRNALPVYIVLGALGAGVLCVLALVLTSNQINEKTTKVAELQTKEAGAKSVADSLRPYGQFATIATARQTQIEQVVQGRFDWDHVVDQLARTTPSNVWLLTVSGTVRPDVQVEAAGGSASSLRDDVPGPAFTIVGCTYSQRSVARMMARMNNIDGVTKVQLAKSARRDEAETGGGAAGAASAAGDAGGAAAQQTEDCIGSSRVTKFEIMVAFEAPAGVTASAAGVPQGGGATVAQAADAAAAAQPAGGASAASASGAGK
jgi:Tfp pilus assembly protein PilN